MDQRVNVTLKPNLQFKSPSYSFKIITDLTHQESVYTAESQLSMGAFDLKITLGFETKAKAAIRSCLIYFLLPDV